MTFFSTDPFEVGVAIVLGDDAARHARALRIGPGNRIELRDGAGRAARGTLSRVVKRSLTVDVDEVWDIAPFEPVHLLVPVADRDHMMMLAEKCTELGATSWRPVMWRRSRSVGPAGDGPAFQARLKARMVSALVQSGGGWLPQIHPSATVERAIAATPPGLRLLLDGAADTGLAAEVLTAPVSIAIGPEGGLDPTEREQMIEGGFRLARLGGNTLRFETAGIAGLAIARAALDKGSTGQQRVSPGDME